jgi:hypothetical protein
MDLYEHLVLQYLTKDAHVFVGPQYSIRGDTGGEWSCPDFVALNFRDKIVLVVEVSSASDPQSLRARVASRDIQWINRLREQLERNRVVDASWNKYHVEVFIRRDAERKFREAIGAANNVVIHILEDLGAPWTWRRSYLPIQETTSCEA